MDKDVIYTETGYLTQLKLNFNDVLVLYPF